MVLPNKNNGENLHLVGSSYVTKTVLETNPFIQQIFIEFTHQSTVDKANKFSVLIELTF